MTVTALRTETVDWNRAPDGALAPALADIAACAFLASAQEPSDPMERALHALVGERLGGGDAVIQGRTLARHFGLRPELPAMTNVWRDPAGGGLACVKGAPEAVMRLCRLDPQCMQRTIAVVEDMAQRGIRVLAVGKASVANEPLPDRQDGFAFGFVGLVGFSDPLRPEVPAAVAECRSAGVRVVMITGDHPATALAVARQAGLASDRLITGAELDPCPIRRSARRSGRSRYSPASRRAKSC
jgi:Ca2+-transporting ATPase